MRRNQNDEFDAAIQEEQERIRQVADDAEDEKRRRNEKLAEFTRLVSALPPEPEAGTTIAVVMPDGKRIMRKFEPTEMGMSVYVWTASRIVNEGAAPTFPEALDIKMAIGPVLALERPLNEQGFTGRIQMVATLKDGPL
jgi:hypothetical protein